MLITPIPTQYPLPDSIAITGASAFVAINAGTGQIGVTTAITGVPAVSAVTAGTGQISVGGVSGSREFTAGSSDRLSSQGGLTPVNSTGWTQGAWTYIITDPTTYNRICVVGDGGTGQNFFVEAGSDTLRLSQQTVAGENYRLSTAILVLNEWQCLIGTFPAGVDANDAHIYCGDLDTPMVNVDAGVVTTAGSRVTGLVNGYVGNRSDSVRAWPGRISQAFMVPWQMTLQECEQFRQGDWSVLLAHGTPTFFLSFEDDSLTDPINGRTWVEVGTTVQVGPGVGSWDYVSGNVIGISANVAVTAGTGQIGSGEFEWPPVGSVVINPGDNWATKVSANPVNTIFAVYPGTHNQVSITPKAGMQFIGPRTALTGGTPKSINGTVYNVGLIEAPTAILDGQNIVVNAFWGANINDVVIKNLEIKNYKFSQQAAAIDCCNNGGRTASDWVIENVYLHHNNYGGLNVGHGTLVRHCRTAYQAYVGYAASYSHGATFEYCEIDHNHTAGDDPWVEASGGKVAESWNFTMRYSWSHDNNGPAMWTDINNYMTDYFACLVEGGTVGIFHEISYNFKIHECEFNDNTGNDGWNNAVLIAASGSVPGEADSEIYNNLFDNNWGAIMMVQQNRGTGSRGAWLNQNTYVHHNLIKNTTLGGGGWQDVGDTAIFNTRNNRWDYNDYVNYPTNGFSWDNAWSNWTSWQATGNDVHGTNIASDETWPPAGSTMINIGDNWQTKSNAGSIGTVFAIAAGTHTGASVTPKANQQFIGPPGTRGIYGPTGLTAIMDGNNFTTDFAFNGSIDGVVIKNLEVRKYRCGQSTQRGAIGGNSGGGGGSPPTLTNCLVQNCYVHHNSMVGIALLSGIVRHCRVSYNGQLGLRSENQTVQVISTEIDNNHKDPGVSGWNASDWGGTLAETGGFKFLSTTGAWMGYCWSHDNDGPGMWTDYHNVLPVYEYNLVEHNAGPGIFHEVSYDAIIRFNTLNDNAYNYHDYWWGPQILISSSGGSDATHKILVYKNILNTTPGGGNGITIIEQSRGDLVPCRFIEVYDNDTTGGGMSGFCQDHGDNSIFTAGNNHFTNNDYHASGSSQYFAWYNNNARSWSDWQAQGMDAGGSYT